MHLFLDIFRRIPRPLVFLLVLFACLEATARIAKALSGDYVYPPFRQRTVEGRQGPAKLHFNQRGAIGGLWNGQAEQIAVLGGSFLMSHGLALDQSIAGFLRLRRPGSHIDVYASVFQTSAKSLAVLEQIRKSGLRYNFLLLEVPVGSFSLKPDPEAFLHTSLWRMEGNFPFHFVSVISRNIHRMANYVPEVRWLGARLGYLDESTLDPGISDCLHHKGKAVSYVEEPYSPNQVFLEESREMMKALHAAGSRVADQVIFVVPPVADAPGEHPGVAGRWCILQESERQPGKYLSKRSFADKFKKNGQASHSIARELGYHSVNLIPLGEELVTKGEHYFADHLHLFSGGSYEVARHLDRAMNRLDQ